MNETTAASLPQDTPRAKNHVVVWDVWVRIFHWSFAALVAAAWLTHALRGSGHAWHEWIGYAAAALVVLRIVWGFVGSEHARFAHFVPGPLHLLGYVRGLVTGNTRRYLTHNPLGAMMVLLLLFMVICQAVTGFVMTHHGMTLFGIGRRPVHQFHALVGNAFLLAVPLHVLGVAFESLRHRENLVRAMIVGTKRAEH